MNTDDATRKVMVAIDEVVSDALAEGVRLLSERGATEEEVIDFIRWYSAQLEADRNSKLAEARSWIERGGEALQ
jgi:hypothetical protein